MGRLLAKIRAEVPALLLLPGIIVGEEISRYSGIFWIGAAASIILSGFLLFIPRRLAILRTLLLGFALGAFAEAIVVLGLPTVPLSSGSMVYLVQVDGRPRFREPGAISIPFLVLRYQVGTAEDSSWIAAPPNTRIYCHGVDLPWRNISAVHEGNILAVKLELEPITPSGNPFGYQSHLLRHGFVATCKVKYASVPIPTRGPTVVGIQERIKKSIRDVVVGDERSGLLLSMVFGVDDTLSTVSERAFRETGLAHLLVVSGYQVTLVYLAISAFVAALLRRILYKLDYPALEWSCALFGVGAALGYSWLVYFDAPTMRAAIGSILAAWAGAVERGKGMVSMLLASMVILLIVSPGAEFDPSAELTYAALWGIWLGIGDRRGIGEYLRVCFYASAMTALVSLPWFGSMSLIGFVLNPIVVPIMSVVSCAGGLIGLLIYSVGIDSNGILLSSCADLLLLFRDLLLHISLNIDGAVLAESTAGILSAIGLSIMIFIRFRSKVAMSL